MRKIISILLMSLIVLGGNIASGQKIDMETAKAVGEMFLNSKLGKVQKSNSELKLAYSSAEYYVFNAEIGFVIVSATDNVTPILAYSTESYFDFENIPPAMKEILDGYKQEIAYITDKQITVKETKGQWDNLKKGNIPKTQKANAVKPLLGELAWGQGTQTQDKWYNDSCPYDETVGKHVPAGCNAVMMAMIMKYYEYPVKGTGSKCYNSDYSQDNPAYTGYGILCADFENTVYNWSSMPNTLTEPNAAVAQLIYHCGVAVNMIYHPDVSLSYGCLDDDYIGQLDQGKHNTYMDVRTALQIYFGYADDIMQIEKKDHTETQWIAAIKAELDKRQPINFGSTSHSYICDGYDEDDYFHLNFGWTGSCNGYFHTSSIVPTQGDWSSNQTDGQYAIMNIKPKKQTGIAETKHATSIKLYPNPTTDRVFVEKESNIKVFSVQGQLLAEIFSAEINLSNYVPGIYFIQINGITTKIIKQ